VLRAFSLLHYFVQRVPVVLSESLSLMVCLLRNYTLPGLTAGPEQLNFNVVVSLFNLLHTPQLLVRAVLNQLKLLVTLDN